MKDSQLSVATIMAAVTGVAVFLGLASRFFSPQAVQVGLIVFVLFFVVSLGLTGMQSRVTNQTSNIRWRIGIGVVFGGLVGWLAMLLS